MDRKQRFLMCGLLFAGGLLRLFWYLSDRSLWFDEATLVCGIIDHSYYQLRFPGDYGETAPLFYLYVVKSLILLFGRSEWVFRLLPFLFSLSSLGLFALFALRVVPPRPALIAIALFSFCDRLLYYSEEAKPYSGDVFFTVLLLLVGMSYLDSWNQHCQRHRNACLLLAFSGSISVFFSLTAMFVLAGLGAAALLLAIRQRYIGLWRDLWVPACWIVSLGISWFAYMRFSAQSTLFAEYFTDSMLNIPSSMVNIRKDIYLLYSLLQYPFNSYKIISSFSIFIFILGMFKFAKNINKFNLLIISIFIFSIIISLLHKYTLYQRHGLFLIPLICLVLSIGSEEISKLLRIPERAKTAFLAFIVVLNGLSIVRPPSAVLGQEDYRGLCAQLAAQPGQIKEAIVVDHFMNAGYRYYGVLSGKYILSEHKTTMRGTFANPNGLQTELASLPLFGKTWIVLSHFKPGQDEPIYRALEARGRRLRTLSANACSAVLFEFGGVAP